MTKDQFYMANLLGTEGWEYNGLDDSGTPTFTRIIGGVLYVAEVKESK